MHPDHRSTQPLSLADEFAKRLRLGETNLDEAIATAKRQAEELVEAERLDAAEARFLDLQNAAIRFLRAWDAAPGAYTDLDGSLRTNLQTVIG